MKDDDILDDFEGFDTDAEVVLIKYLNDATTAHIYAAKLREEGIKTFLSSSNMNTVLPTSFSQVGLHINKENLDAAQIIIHHLDLQHQSDSINFSIENASPEDIDLEKKIIQQRKQKSDATYKIIIFILVFVIAIVLLRYLLAN